MFRYNTYHIRVLGDIPLTRAFAFNKCHTCQDNAAVGGASCSRKDNPFQHETD